MFPRQLFHYKSTIWNDQLNENKNLPKWGLKNKTKKQGAGFHFQSNVQLYMWKIRDICQCPENDLELY